MTARHLMIVAAVAYGLTGAALLFTPLATAQALALAADAGNEDTLQLLGAALLSFALLDWQGRSAIYGGIYGRPITTGNLLLATYLALGWGRVAWGAGGPDGTPAYGAWLASVLFLGIAVGFGGLAFNRSWIRTDAP